MNNEFIPLIEAEKLVKESGTTIKRRIWDGKILHKKDENGKYRVDKSSLFRYCKKIDVEQGVNVHERSMNDSI